MNNNINIIIIGAAKILSIDDIKTWNNYNQAKHSELLDFIDLLSDSRGYKNVKISTIDPEYPKTIIDKISYHKDSFNLESIKYYNKDSINIIIEFCNMFNEGWIFNQSNNKKIIYNTIKDYNISIIACGCEWNNNFPINTILGILDFNFYTPMDPYNVSSYLNMISFTELIKEFEIFDIMKPYICGCFMILGTLLYRNSNSEEEAIIRQVIELVQWMDNNIEIKDFINYKKSWRQMSRNVRVDFCNYIYGMITSIDK
jgi:hypothetical protein